ncbi:MAG: Na/Pi cotransporter family protein [Chitinophagaceae bacterium]
METILLILGGLGLFLFAISHLSEALKHLLGDRAKKLVAKFTRNVFTAILTGIVITLILDSSSAVIIMAIVLVNAKALTFRQAIGIVLGANIGTTFSSQIIAMDIGKFSPIPIFLGLLLIFFSKADWVTRTGRVIIYFGILFFGLYTMERAVEPLRDHPQFMNWMGKLESPLTGAGTGALVTLIIQSSSATVGMVITMAKKGLLSLTAAIAVMLGAELGTCADTLLATVKGNRQALKTGIFHLFFNISTIFLGLLFFPLFIQMIIFISGSAQLEQQVANAHMLFNLIGVVVFLPFIGKAEKILNKLLPDKIPQALSNEQPIALSAPLNKP